MPVAPFVQNVIYLEFGAQVLKSTVLKHDSIFPVNSCLCLRKAVMERKGPFHRQSTQMANLGNWELQLQSLLAFQTMAVMKYGILLNKFQMHKKAYQNFSFFLFFCKAKYQHSPEYSSSSVSCGGSPPGLGCGVAADFLLPLLLLIFLLLLFLNVFIVVKYA